ncbi:hypothetical protein [Methylocystis parvus]|uniref:hypothetical protein n=1 Tax=Methylocystis parvus TaxID=134 RepID=UPI003C754A33
MSLLDDIAWRTEDVRWPAPTGAPITAEQYDGNNYALADAIMALQAALADGPLSIVSIEQTSPTEAVITFSDASTVTLILPTSRPGYSEVAATTKTLALIDSWKFLDCTHTSGVAVTVPANADVPFDIGEQITFLHSGGAISFAGAAGVTITAPAGRAKATARKGAWVGLEKTGTNIWKLFGDLDRATRALATSGAISLDPALGDATITPAGDATINATSVLKDEFTIIVTTSGTTSRDITFGTNFKSQGVLSTGTTTAKEFVVRFIGDGTTYREISRTAAM